MGISGGITAVLNGYRRPQNLDLQMAALREQSEKPADVLVWHNAPGLSGMESNRGVGEVSKSAYCNVNLGVWARFAYALNAKTEYVCVFDDDTIPGVDWFSNCLETMRKKEALLGTVGILYLPPIAASDSPKSSYYNRLVRLGWPHPNELSAEVDFVGHSWFFKREWLSAFWRELPDPDFSLCGEDMHFSYALQRYLGIPTVVPPHPPGKKELWGSTRAELGTDTHALWEKAPAEGGRNQKEDMNRWFVTQRRKGWRLVNE